MKVLLSILFSCVLLTVQSQDINLLLKEAANLEKQQKEPEATEKYKQILLLQPINREALVKAAELTVLLAQRQTNKNAKRLYFETALAYANRALLADSNNADANYAMSMASGKMADVETENKKIVTYMKEVKRFADKALSINPHHAKANYALGKWHYEMTTLSGIKKIAVKLFYGGLPDGDIEKAIQYMEKCKSLEPYFVTNYLGLALAYKENRKPAQAIEVLNKLIKLPTRTSDDIASKAEGVRLLELMQ
ncbi:MAG: hypothetical protein Q8L07_06370 [Sediminibacterium sp.]|nr:hypothetical protein [Sediminibacterium sp.]MDP3665965.1 hypothetical protein [Sediminibacterium sp.]